MRIGLDFDNTIIGYSDVFVSAAKTRRLLGPDVRCASKQAVRDAVRRLPDGEIAWQRLQGFVYGRGICEATMFAGVDPFLRRCRAQGHATFIVSHKTEYGHYDPERVNLREAALGWMTAHGFFRADGYGMSPDNVHFESTRAEKLRRIALLDCTHFIDDLEEVLDDPGFPPAVTRILFSDGAGGRGRDPPFPSAPHGSGSRAWCSMDTPDLGFALAEEVARTLLGTTIDALERVGGGRNSRVFHVRSPRGAYALKQYPAPEDDPRDRLATEIAALSALEQQGFDCVPRVAAADRPRGFAMLSWIDGTPVGAIGDADIDQACRFLARVHALHELPAFPPARVASEACLSGAEIERQIAGRLSALAAVADEEPELHAFLDRGFRPAWARLVARGRERIQAAGLDFAAPLPEERRSLVPSDFGFHNCIRHPDGSLAFIDFEYFGWDDPVKLTSDVLFHPGVPLPDGQRGRFRAQALSILGGDAHFASRLDAYLPLFSLRWVLIVLNEFLPPRWRLRRLAGTADSWGEAKQRQLGLARNLLARAEAA